MKVLKILFDIAGLLGLSALCYLNLKFCAGLDFSTYSEKVSIEALNPAAQLLMAAVLCALLVLLRRWLSRHLTRTGAWKAVLVMTVLFLAAGLFFASQNDYEPVSDQWQVWAMSDRIANGTTDYELNRNTLIYWRTYPQQATMAFLYAGLMKLFHLTRSSLFGIRALQTVFAAGLIPLMYLFVREWYQDEAAAVCSALFCTLWTPLLLYTAYLYPTSISLTLTVLAFWLCGRALHEPRHRLRHLLLAGLVLILDNLFYMATAIASVACVLIVVLGLLAEKQEPAKKRLLYGLLFAVLVFGGGWLCREGIYAWMEQTYGFELHEGMPASAWIMLGISVEEGANGGPGSYDSSAVYMYELCHWEKARMDTESRRAVAYYLSRYLSGEASLYFFERKTICQWCDPWFASVPMTLYRGAETSSAFLNALYDSSVMPALEKALHVAEVCVVLLAALWSLSALKRIVRKELDFYALLPLVYFAGGFVFQFFWEAKARYCEPYFVLLVPLAMAELGRLEQAVQNHRRMSKEQQTPVS